MSRFSSYPSRSRQHTHSRPKPTRTRAFSGLRARTRVHTLLECAALTRDPVPRAEPFQQRKRACLARQPTPCPSHPRQAPRKFAPTIQPGSEGVRDTAPGATPAQRGSETNRTRSGVRSRPAYTAVCGGPRKQEKAAREYRPRHTQRGKSSQQTPFKGRTDRRGAPRFELETFRKEESPAKTRRLGGAQTGEKRQHQTKKKRED